MPFINLKLAKGRTIEQKKRFVKAITKEAVEILNVKAEWVTVVIDEYDRRVIGQQEESYILSSLVKDVERWV